MSEPNGSRPFAHLHVHRVQSWTAPAGSTTWPSRRGLPPLRARPHRPRRALRRRPLLQGLQGRRGQADHRLRGVRRPAQPLRARRARPTPISSTWCCSPTASRGYRNLIGLVTDSNVEGFYYKPRVDRELLARYSARPDRDRRVPVRARSPPSSCRTGRTRRGAWRASTRTCSARTGSSSNCRTTGSRSKPRSTRPRSSWRGTSGSAWSRRTTPTTSTRADAQGARRAAVHRHQLDARRSQAAALRRRSVLLQEPGGDGGAVRGVPGGAGEHRT